MHEFFEVRAPRNTTSTCVQNYRVFCSSVLVDQQDPEVTTCDFSNKDLAFLEGKPPFSLLSPCFRTNQQ